MLDMSLDDCSTANPRAGSLLRCENTMASQPVPTSFAVSPSDMKLTRMYGVSDSTAGRSASKPHTTPTGSSFVSQPGHAMMDVWPQSSVPAAAVSTDSRVNAMITRTLGDVSYAAICHAQLALAAYVAPTSVPSPITSGGCPESLPGAPRSRNPEHGPSGATKRTSRSKPKSCTDTSDSNTTVRRRPGVRMMVSVRSPSWPHTVAIGSAEPSATTSAATPKKLRLSRAHVMWSSSSRRMMSTCTWWLAGPCTVHTQRELGAYCAGGPSGSSM
mmetsp:Transcript_23238/g.80960  ORF Transcript_23238/g.80960 Transcript_23238/m.80960 type:complete len:272 (+) Transcript_23238:10689-11504(+)